MMTLQTASLLLAAMGAVAKQQKGWRQFQATLHNEGQRLNVKYSAQDETSELGLTHDSRVDS